MSLSNHTCLMSAKSPRLSPHERDKVTARSKTEKFFKSSDVHSASFPSCHRTTTTSSKPTNTNSNCNNLTTTTTTTTTSSNNTSNARAINNSSTSMIKKEVGSGPPSPAVASQSFTSSYRVVNKATAAHTIPATTPASNIIDASVSATSATPTTTTAATTTTTTTTTTTNTTYKTAAADFDNRQDDDTYADEFFTTAISSSSSSCGKGNIDYSCYHCDTTKAHNAGADKVCRLTPTQGVVDQKLSTCSSIRSNSISSSTGSTCTISCSCSCNSSCNSKCYCSCTRRSAVDGESCLSSNFTYSTKTKSSHAGGRIVAVHGARESAGGDSRDQESYSLSYGLRSKTDSLNPKESVASTPTPPADNCYCTCCFGKTLPSYLTPTPDNTSSPLNRAQTAGETSANASVGTNRNTKGETQVTDAKITQAPSHSIGSQHSHISPTKIAAVDSGKIGVSSGLLTSKPVQLVSRQLGLQASPTKSATSHTTADGRRKPTVQSTTSSNSRDTPSKQRHHKLCFSKQNQPRQQKSGTSLTSRGSNVSNITRSGGWKFNKMGNGSSHGGGGHVVIDGESLEVSRIKSLIPEMRRELRKKESMIARYEAELHEKIRELKERTADIQRLRGEVHKLRSVLQLKVCNEEGRPDILATIQETLPNNNAGDQRLKRQGVSGESYNNSGGISSIELKHHEKDFR